MPNEIDVKIILNKQGETCFIYIYDMYTLHRYVSYLICIIHRPSKKLLSHSFYGLLVFGVQLVSSI